MLKFCNSPRDTQSYELDEFGRVFQRFKDHEKTELVYGPNGRVWKLIQGDGSVIEYAYDETGKRILKKKNGEIVEGYLGSAVITQDSMLQPVKMNGVVLGVLENRKFTSVLADSRGSLFHSQESSLEGLTAYGEKKGEWKNPHASVLEYAAQGYDADLQAYRMEQRDYDPKLKRFMTPDPLFLESAEKCLESPLECSLYGYAAGNPVSFVDPEGGFAVNPWTISAGISFVSWAYHEVASSRVTGDAIYPTTSLIDFFAGAGGASAGQAIGQQVNYQIAKSELMFGARTADVSTKYGEAVFHSGVGADKAMTFASDIGKKTIELTSGGNWAHNQNVYSVLKKADAEKFWTGLSERFAGGASGPITIFEKVRPLDKMETSVFRSIELPILTSNPNVTQHTHHLLWE